MDKEVRVDGGVEVRGTREVRRRYCVTERQGGEGRDGVKVDVREEVLGGCSRCEEERRLAVQIFVLVEFRGGRGDSLVLDIT